MQREDYYNDTIASESQKPDVGELITLYQLDATHVGASSIWYFTQAVKDTGPVFFNSQEYTPIDIKAEGFDVSTGGTLARPKLAVSNVDSTLASEIIEYNDLLGCKLIRIRTLSKYLDGEPAADPTVEFPRDVYTIHQKVIQNKQIVQWELAAKIDMNNLKIPRRQILRDTCTHTYRYYSSGFVYTNISCPYTGSSYFTFDGTPTTNADEDVCGRKLSDCKLRYPLTTDQLPTRAFPMVARTRL